MLLSPIYTFCRERMAVKTKPTKNLFVNAMMPKYKEKLKTAQRRMEEAKAKMEKHAAQNAAQEVSDLLSWVRDL